MKDIYVVISATKSKIGKCIRLLTNNSYNHVSISFDDDLKDMISFARYYHEIPFYGGYIHESMERYEDSNIILYKVRVTNEDYQRVVNAVEEFEENASDYLYHTINAVLCPFNKEVYIERAYTCLSFATCLLANSSLKLPTIYNIKQLMRYLEPFKVYEGTIKNYFLHSNPSYLQNFSMSERFIRTYSHQMKLVSRLIKKRSLKI